MTTALPLRPPFTAKTAAAKVQIAQDAWNSRSMGNLAENDKAFIFLMDYANRRRIKIWGRAEVVEDDPELLEQLVDPAYQARLERVFRFHIEAWDSNCPQHITPRFTAAEIEPEMQQLRDRIAQLEAEVAVF